MLRLTSFVVRGVERVATDSAILILHCNRCLAGMMNMPHLFAPVLYQKMDSSGAALIISNKNIDLSFLLLNFAEHEELRKLRIDIVMIQTQISTSTYQISPNWN